MDSSDLQHFIDGEKMTKRSSGIRFIPGSTDILIVAPHGPVIDGEYQNDLRTGIVAAEIQRELDCTAVINDRFFKPKGESKESWPRGPGFPCWIKRY